MYHHKCLFRNVVFFYFFEKFFFHSFEVVYLYFFSCGTVPSSCSSSSMMSIWILLIIHVSLRVFISKCTFSFFSSRRSYGKIGNALFSVFLMLWNLTFSPARQFPLYAAVVAWCSRCRGTGWKAAFRCKVWAPRSRRHCPSRGCPSAADSPGNSGGSRRSKSRPGSTAENQFQKI